MTLNRILLVLTFIVVSYAGALASNRVPREIDFFQNADDFQTSIFATDLEDGYRGWFESKKYMYPLPVYGALYYQRAQLLDSHEPDEVDAPTFFSTFKINDSGYEKKAVEMVVSKDIITWLYGAPDRMPNNKEGEKRVNAYLNLVAQNLITLKSAQIDGVEVTSYIFDETLDAPGNDTITALAKDPLLQSSLLGKPDTFFEGTLFAERGISAGNIKKEIQNKQQEEAEKLKKEREEQEKKKKEEAEKLEKELEEQKKKELDELQKKAEKKKLEEEAAAEPEDEPEEEEPEAEAAQEEPADELEEELVMGGKDLARLAGALEKLSQPVIEE